VEGKGILVRQGWVNVEGDFWTPPTSGAWIKFDTAIEVATSPEFANIRRILGMRDVFNRIEGDAINMTMEEFCKVKEVMECGNTHEISFDEDFRRCREVCDVLGVQLLDVKGKQWRAVVVDGFVR
jgi:hypothetical protein